MPAESAITPLGRQLIAMLPSWAREDPDMKAVAHCFAQESDRIMERGRALRDGLIAGRTGEVGVPFWERLLRAPSGETLEQRQANVRAALLTILPDPTGLTWERKVSQVLGPTWSYVEDAANYTVTIQTALPSGDPQLVILKARIREFTPAHLDLILLGVEGIGEGFILDVKQLDIQQLGQPRTGPGGEIMVNGTFEATDISHWAAIAGATLTRTTAQHHTGVAALSVEMTGTQYDGAYQEGAGEPAVPYEATIWVKAPVGFSYYAGLAARDGAHAYLAEIDGNTVVGNGFWQRHSLSGTSPANTAYVLPQVNRPTAGSATTVYVDDVSVHAAG